MVRGPAIFLVSFALGVALTKCTAQEQQIADRSMRDVCRVITYDTDGGDPLLEFIRALDEIDRIRREGRDGGAREGRDGGAR
jgi:hypothetical protein